MKYSSKIQKCGLSPMRKFAPFAAAAVEKGKTIYHLNIGQPDVVTPSAFLDEIKGVNIDVLSYSPSQGEACLINAVTKYYAGIGVELDSKDILVTNGGSEALQMIFAAILDDGDEILIPEPFYPNYDTFAKLAGAKVVPIPTTPEEGYRFADKAKIEACITENTRAILFTNPGNPTGLVLSDDELKLILDIAKEHDLFVIGDEVYREFIYNNCGLKSLLQYPGYEENVIVVDSVSKRFSACGARIGCAISKNKELMAECMKWCQGRLCISTLDQIGAAALYNVGSDYFASVREEYKARRDTLVEELKKIPGIIFSEPDGAFYVMAALPVDDAEKFQYWLLEEYDDNGDTVMFAPAEKFYATPNRGKNEIRMAYVINRDDIKRAIELLKKGIEAYNARG